MIVQPATDFAELCFHALAHLPLRGPERLFDPRYIAYAEKTLPLEAREPLVTDASALGAALDAASCGLAVQGLPLLFPDIASFLGDPDLSRLTAALGDAPAIAWLGTDLLLIGEAFAASYHRTDAVTIAEVEALLAVVPASHRPDHVALCRALGPRGRGFARRGFVSGAGALVMVGAPAAYFCVDEIDRAIPAVLALHEHAVLEGHGDYVEREWHALVNLASRIADYERLAPAHQRWLASLDLSALIRDAAARGYLDAARGEQLVTEPLLRAQRLRA